ncbi:uncharacterized protein RhoGAP18B isoform X2 [Drosophila virilis]|uniref:uncharacterized protein RhoGAP18B isoform X2 n=1 Tax=Drosophila virilis TaxID=7244 RepID=UPI0038B23BB4
MPQQVEMKSSKRNSSEIGDNNKKQHISNQNEATYTQLRSKRSRQQQQQHIYENLPVSAASQQLRKYFRREVIYENLCRGCGYGVFAAQGRYCHFCQCIVSGSVVAALQQQTQPQPQPQSTSPTNSSECNIYENICELCRGIYSDSEQCECATSATPTSALINEKPQLPTSPPPPLLSLPPQAFAAASAAASAKSGKSRTLLNYSKSSAATLTRLFGSLKQLNRSGSLQRRLFQREGGAAKAGVGSGGSLEIIHNVDEVFRTQETFDMQRICELKRQLQCSRSDQHIYGRLRAEREPQPESEAASTPAPAPESQPEEESVTDLARKKPRISRMRLLRQDEQQPTPAATSTSALYLNESICQWMNALRRELHSYEDANGGVGCQQPKAVPPAYEREREREREREQETDSVMLRRNEAVAEEAAVAAEPALQQRLVNDFKRKLLAKREQQQQQHFQLDNQLEAQLAPQCEALLNDRRRRRCGINERHDAAFVCEFLSGLAVSEQATAAETFELTVAPAPTQAAAATTIAAAALLAGRLSLPQLWQSAALAASLHRSVICFFGYDKLLSAFLHSSQRRQRLRSVAIERWLRRYRRLCESDSNSSAERESALRQRQRQRQRQRRRLLGPPSLELAVVPATPASDDVAVVWRVGSVSDTIEQSESEIVSACVREKECESESQTRSVCGSSSGVVVGSVSSSALMAAPKQSGDAQRSSCDDSENNSNYNNTNNNNNNKEHDNVSQQQQQQQLQQLQQTIQQVPVRNPSTSLTKPRNEIDNEHENANNNNALEETAGQKNEDEQEHAQEEAEEEEEESIYQTIWQFKTLEPVPDGNDEDFEIIAAPDAGSDDDADVDVDVDIDVETLTLQAAAAFAAGARHKLTKQATPTASPLPSPTASMDQGAWETDDEFMFAKADEQQQQQQQREQHPETLSVGSTVTNSTATLGSISSAGSSSIGSGRDVNVATSSATQTLTHPLLRNICIFYSLKEPQKYSAIFYDYQRSQIHQRFMTRIRRPAPPLPSIASASASALTATAKATAFGPAAATAAMSPSNDDSGCSCEAESEDLSDQILHPLKEDWALAVLAAAASTKRGVAARAGRKLRVRSRARLLVSTSVLAWREQLQDVNCCEDEEDMIVPVTDILRAQQIQEDNEVQQSQQTTILQRFKSASIGNLVDLPGEDDKKSIKNRMRMKFAVNSNVFRLNRSPKSEKKSRTRRSQVNSLCLDEQSKYPLFGARLNALELNMSDHPYVPRFVVDVCAHIERADCIEQDGIYRASGNKLLVDELKRKLTHLYDPRCLQTDDIHTLTSLHKQFFRELPAPLITQEAYERLGRCLTDDAAIERMRLAFDEMPEPNRSTLRFLIKHLTNVAASSSSNRMPASNLAIVWGPCLLAANDINFDIGRMNMLAKVLIENYDRIFRPANERLVC